MVDYVLSKISKSLIFRPYTEWQIIASFLEVKEYLESVKNKPTLLTDSCEYLSDCDNTSVIGQSNLSEIEIAYKTSYCSLY